jgi:hypothetical protein
LKGRYIEECIRLIYDLIDKLEEDDIPGLLLLVDFEKTFDTVEWSFIENTLQFYGFGELFMASPPCAKPYGFGVVKINFQSCTF